MLARKAFLALLLACFVLELSRNAPNTIRYSKLVLVKTSRAIFARFNPGYILKFPGIAFLTFCRMRTTNHFITGGADFTQCSFGWVGKRIVGAR